MKKEHDFDEPDLAVKCPSCGIEWVDHRGATSLCQRLQEAKKAIEELLHFVEQPEYSRDISEMEVYFDVVENAERILKEY